MWKVAFQVSSEDLSVLLMNFLNDSNPVALVVRRIVAARTMIYTESFGAQLVRAESVLLDVGFTVSPVC